MRVNIHVLNTVKKKVIGNYLGTNPTIELLGDAGERPTQLKQRMTYLNTSLLQFFLSMHTGRNKTQRRNSLYTDLVTIES